MDQAEKTNLIKKVQEGIDAYRKLEAEKSKASIEDVFLNTDTWPLLLQFAQIVFSFFGSIFGIGKAKEISIYQAQVIELEKERNEKLEAIYQHLEKTCMKAEDAKALINDLKNEIIEGTAEGAARKLPGELMRMRMNFVRDSE